MTDSSNLCYACTKTVSSKFYDLKDIDNDNISYWNKLKICINSELVRHCNFFLFSLLAFKFIGGNW